MRESRRSLKIAAITLAFLSILNSLTTLQAQELDPVPPTAAEDSLLHYNLGLAYYRNSDLQAAREHLQSAMKANPTHATSHLVLGHVYRAMNKRIPAIFAFSRFLVLEPNSGRS